MAWCGLVSFAEDQKQISASSWWVTILLWLRFQEIQWCFLASAGTRHTCGAHRYMQADTHKHTHTHTNHKKGNNCGMPIETMRKKVKCLLSTLCSVFRKDSQSCFTWACVYLWDWRPWGKALKFKPAEYMDSSNDLINLKADTLASAIS